MRGRLARTAARISGAVTRFEEITLAGGILGIAMLTIGNVLARSAGKSLYFAEEVSQFLIVMVTFLGLGYAAGKGRHIRMTAFYDQFPDRWRKVVMLLISSTTALLLFFLAYLALDYALGTVRALGSVSPVLRVPRWLVYLAAPLGFALAGIQYLLAFVKNLLAPEVYLSFDVRDEHAAEPAAM
jgi:TRAP-type C4-dicarboxylate transport system permease small subunit